MYDELICDYPLPDCPKWARSFQITDFDCDLSTYTITDNGELWLSSQLFGKADSKPVHLNDFHGDIEFYTSNVRAWSKEEGYTLQRGTGDIPLSPTYKARFTHGKVEWIKRIG